MSGALEAIIFDFDGVIANSEHLHLRTYREVLAPLGLTLSDEDYFTRYLGYDDHGVLRHFARENELSWDAETIASLVEAKTARYEALVASGDVLFAGAANFISLAAARVPLAIASGALTHEIELILERNQLLGSFAAVVGADQTERTKPSPDPYLEAFHRLTHGERRLEPSRTVAIEDSLWGLVSAATAGLRCVAVTNTYPAEELAPHAELVTTGLDALTLERLDDLCASSPKRVALKAQGRKP